MDFFCFLNLYLGEILLIIQNTNVIENGNGRENENEKYTN